MGLIDGLIQAFSPKEEHQPAAPIEVKSSPLIALPLNEVRISSTDKLAKKKSPPFIDWNQKALNPYYGAVGGTYYAQTGMPWLSSDARKAVKTEWFWQPIRGQPRRVDTNELRKYANTLWAQSAIQTILNQIDAIPYDFVPKEEYSYEEAEDEIKQAKDFFKQVNKNFESWNDVQRAWLKDVKEIDAGVLVKVFSIDSYDFEFVEPRSGAPLLKPLICPECEGNTFIGKKHAHDKASRVLKAIKEQEKSQLANYDLILEGEKEQVAFSYEVLKPNYEPIKKAMEVISSNSPSDENTIRWKPNFIGANELVLCPFCKGTGQGRHMQEIYCQDGASFLKDADRTGWTYGYWQYSYSIPAHPMWFNRDELVYFMENPRSMSVYGWADMQSALEHVKTLEASLKHNLDLINEGAVPSGIVSVENMDPDDMNAMADKFSTELKGQNHKTLFMNKKATYQPFAFNNRDMQFTEGIMQLWKQVLAQFKLSPNDVGITEDVNRATAGNQSELSRRKAIRPLLKKAERLVDEEILTELGLNKIEFVYIVDDPVEERMNAELNEIYIRMGVKTPQMVAEEMGLPPIQDLQNDLRQMGFPIDSIPGTGMNEQQGIQDTASATQDQPNDVSEKSFKSEEQYYKSVGLKKKEWQSLKLVLKFLKDYSWPFQAQVPFLTTIQNLSTPTPFALPHNSGHVNTRAPYNAISAQCPGCGKPTLVPIDGANLNARRMWDCSYCQRQYGDEELLEAVGAQRLQLQNQWLSGRQTEFSQNDSVAQEVEEYTEAQGYPAWNRKYYDVDLTQKGVGDRFSSIIEGIREWVDVVLLPNKTQQFIANYGFDLIPTEERNKGFLRQIFSEAFRKNLSLTAIVDKIMSIGFNQIQAEAIARTESVRIVAAAKILDAQDTGVKELRWIVSRDSKLCKMCSEMDGKIFSLKDAVGKIPRHPNCRCHFEDVTMMEGI